MASAAGPIGVDALGDPALIVGANYQVLAANEGGVALFGERIRGGDLRLVGRHPAVLDTVALAMTASESVTREVNGLGFQEGAFRVRAAPLANSAVLLTFTDITQARLTERMRVDFIANASHELRTPLATILGFIETLQGPAADDAPARARFLDIMGREAGRMQRLIDDLLSLSRIELDKYVRPQTRLYLSPLIADVGKTLAMRLESDSRHLEFQVPDDLPPVIGDRDQVLQVLYNLVSNALKYGWSGTPITIAASLHASPRDPVVRITVSDQGDGIHPKHLPRLTERFYRVDTNRSRAIGGTGLGLAIVKHIVERHRGRLEIESVQGEGTRIAFTLPAVLPAVPPPPPSPD